MARKRKAVAYASDSDYDEDDGELQRRNRLPKKRKDDDGTMASLGRSTCLVESDTADEF